MRRRTVFALATIWPTVALGCPEGSSSTMFGGCLPNIGGTPGQIGQHAIEEARGQIVGNPLAAWIQQSRDNAIGTSSPIPPGIRQQLAGFIDDDAMNRVRYKIGDSGALNAAHNVEAANQAVRAVTLIDVIVFRTDTDASDPALWAHELTHVKQYRDWGVRDFAIRYSRDPNIAEDPAYAAQANYPNWYAQHQVVSPSPGGPQTTTCSTQFGTCQLPFALPPGVACSCNSQNVSMPRPTYR